MHRSLLSAAWAAVLSGALVAQAPEPSPTPATSADPLAVLAALPLAATPTRGVRIVVRDANGAPAKAAQLVFVASDEPRYLSSSVDASSRSRGDEPSYWALRVASGARFAVDDYGNARVPAVDGRVFAWHDDVVASKAFTIEDGKPPSRVDLDLKPPLEFVVTVVGNDGAPVHGVPVGVVAGPRSATLPRARTDVQGRIAFRLLPTRNAEARLRLGAATKQSIEVPLPTHGGEAQLQLPECGSVRVTFADELVPGATIRWTLMRADRTFEPTATEERAALFDFVETGFEGTARAALPSGTLTAPVPAVTAGAQSTVALERSAKEQIVTLRVLDPNGEPVRSSFVSVEWRHERRQHGNPGRTTSEGWLELVRPTHAANADRLVIDMRGRNPEDPPIGRIELPLGAPDPGRIDRGEHRLVPAKPLLAGVLVEADGRPIPWVRLQAASEDQPGATSDAAGRFVFRAMEREQAALRLTVESPGWFFPEPASRTRTVDAGVDVKLVLQPAGRMRFAAQGLPDQFHCDFTIRLEPAGGDGERIEIETTWPMRELLLPRGHWHVVLVEDERELHRIENVRVDAGIEVHDSRFMEFDWRAFATLVTLRIEDKDGEPFDECSVMHQYGNRGRGHEPKAGVIRWLVAKEGGDLSVHPRGHRFAAVPLGRITGERVVRIGGGPELVVQLAVVPKLPDDGALFAFLDQSYNALPFDTEGKLSVWLHEPGERTLRIGLRKGNSMHWLDVVAQPITVPAAGLTHRLELPAGLQAAIDRVTR